MANTRATFRGRNGADRVRDRHGCGLCVVQSPGSRGDVIDPQTPVYQGMIVGEHSRDNDLEINVLKGKKLTNVRAAGSDEAMALTLPRRMSLEDMMAYIDSDEPLEVTPSLRLRKRYLRARAQEIPPPARRGAGDRLMSVIEQSAKNQQIGHDGDWPTVSPSARKAMNALMIGTT